MVCVFVFESTCVMRSITSSYIVISFFSFSERDVRALCDVGVYLFAHFNIFIFNSQTKITATCGSATTRRV